MGVEFRRTVGEFDSQNALVVVGALGHLQIANLVQSVLVLPAPPGGQFLVLLRADGPFHLVEVDLLHPLRQLAAPQIEAVHGLLAVLPLLGVALHEGGLHRSDHLGGETERLDGLHELGVQVLGYKELFRGSVHGSAVYPREVGKEALKENAAAVILADNYPGGHVSPSPDDLRFTEEPKSILSRIDARVVDHIIVGGNSFCSLAREGLLT